MITDKPNMGREQIFTELPLPSKVKEVTLQLIYKALFIIVKLLLDSRLNLVKISEGKSIQTKHQKIQQGSRGQRPDTKKPDNPIKGLDDIKIEDKPVVKKVELTEGKTKTNTKDPKNTPSPVEPPDVENKETKPTPETDSGQKSTEQVEKSDEATNDTNKPKEEK